MSDDLVQPGRAVPQQGLSDARLFVVRAPLLGADGNPNGAYHYVLAQRTADLHPERVEDGLSAQAAVVANSLAELFQHGPLCETVAITSVHDKHGGGHRLFSMVANGNMNP